MTCTLGVLVAILDTHGLVLPCLRRDLNATNLCSFFPVK
jgi:hypothetical protein